MNLRNALVLLTAGSTLAGCSPSLLGASGGTGPAGAPLDSSTVLSAYTRTFSNGTNTALDSEQSGSGLEGMGVGTESAASAATPNATYLTGKIGISPDQQNATFTLGGHTYTMSKVGSNISGTGAYSAYTVAQYSDADTSGTQSYDTLNLINNGSVSLAILSRNIAKGEHDPLTEPDAFGIPSIFLGGNETLPANIPHQQVSYSGVWDMTALPVAYGTGSGGGLAMTTEAYGTFAADADFNSHALTLVGKDSSNNVAINGTGTISGSQFNGNVTFAGPASGSGTMAGAFYGPAADQIGGVINGTGTVNGEGDGPVIGGFIGDKTP